MRVIYAVLFYGLVSTSVVCAGPLEDGNGAYQRGEFGKALEFYRPLAERGNASAQTQIGIMYESGQGVPRDLAEAMRWYRKAADQGFALGQSNVGNLYANGWGVPQNSTEALRWFHRAADQGLAAAQVKLGLMHQFGHGVPQDYGEALSWFRRSADQGNSDGQTAVGFMYLNGLGVERDIAEAATWFRKSAEQGNENAKSNLAELYKKFPQLIMETSTRLPSGPFSQTAKRAEQNRHKARAEICMSDDRTMSRCLEHLRQEEESCYVSYRQAAFDTLGYKKLGFSIEAALEQIASDYRGYSSDILLHLVRAGFSVKWPSSNDFPQAAAHRCLIGDPF